MFSCFILLDIQYVHTLRRDDLLCNTVAAEVMNSGSIFWHGVKVDRANSEADMWQK